MPLALARAIQAGLPAMDFGSMAQVAGEVAWEEQIGNSLVVREPIGVVGCITPWNYPLHQICAKVAPALTAGCSVVVKPSEVTPLTSFILAEIIDSLDLPAGVFNLVTGYGPVVGEAIAAHDGRRHGLVHRLDQGRAASQRGRVPDREEGRARARRQVGERDPRRRRSEDRRRLRRLQLLPQLRPDLQRPHPDAGAAGEARRGRAGRGCGRREGDAGRPLRGGDAARPAGLRGAARARPRLHREGARRRARSWSRAAPSRRRGSRAATSSARRSSPR